MSPSKLVENIKFCAHDRLRFDRGILASPRLMTVSLALVISSLALGFLCAVFCLKHSEEQQHSTDCAEHFSSVTRPWDLHDKVTTFGADIAHNAATALGMPMLSCQNIPCAPYSLQLSLRKAAAESGTC